MPAPDAPAATYHYGPAIVVAYDPGYVHVLRHVHVADDDCND